MESEMEFLVQTPGNDLAKSTSSTNSLDSSSSFLSPEDSQTLQVETEDVRGGGGGETTVLASAVTTPKNPTVESVQADSFLTPESGFPGPSADGVVGEEETPDGEARSPELVRNQRQRHAPKKYTPPVPVKGPAKQQSKEPSEYGKKRFRKDEEPRPVSPGSKAQLDSMVASGLSANIEFTVVRNKTEKNTSDLKEFVSTGLASLEQAEPVGAFTDAAPPELTAADILPLGEKRSAGRPRVPKEVKKGKDRKKQVQLSAKEREFLKSDFRDGAKIRSLSEKYKVSIATASKIAHELHPPAPRGGPTIRKMTPAVSQYLNDTLHESPTTSTKALVEGIKQKFNLEVHRTTVDKHVTSKKMSDDGFEPFSFTKLYTHELARNSEETKAERKIHVQQYRTLKNSGLDFIFADECPFALTTYARRGWSVKGERTVVRKRRFRVENVTGIVFASVRFGLVHAMWVIGAVTDLVFQAALIDFIKHYQALNKAQACLMIDNVNFHCTDTVRDILTKHNYHVLHAARYSPELMPIELIFAIIKARVVIDPSYTTPTQIIPSLMKATNSITVDEVNASVAHVETHMHPRAAMGDDLNLRDSLAGFRADKKLLGPERAAAVHNPKGSPLLKKYKKAKIGGSTFPVVAAAAPVVAAVASEAPPAQSGVPALPSGAASTLPKSLQSPAAAEKVGNSPSAAPSSSDPSAGNTEEETDDDDEEVAWTAADVDALSESLPTLTVKRSRDGSPKFKSPVSLNASAEFFQGVYHPPLPHFRKMLQTAGKDVGDSTSLNNDCLYNTALQHALGRHTDPHVILALIPLLRRVLGVFMRRPDNFQELLPFFLNSAEFLLNHIAGVEGGGVMGTITELMMICRLFDRPALVHPDNTDRPLKVHEALAGRSAYMHLAHLGQIHFVPVWPIDGDPVIGLGAQPLIRLEANGVLELIE